MVRDVVGFGGDAVPPADPEREGYTFTGWDTDYTNVTANLTVQALYEQQLFSITWENWDGEVLEVDENVPYGEMPSYDGDEPTRPATAENEYTFDGWAPTVSPVTGDVTYTAQFTESARAYVIRWENWDGELLEEDSIVYGEMPTYDGDTPERPDEDVTTFTFSEWSPEVEPVTGDINLHGTVHRADLRRRYSGSRPELAVVAAADTGGRADITSGSGSDGSSAR